MKNTELKVYVGTYGKYNNGNLGGAWLSLTDYIDYDDFIEACAELHEDEEDPEFMFQDFEADTSLFESFGLISEGYISEDLWDVLEELEDSGQDIEVYEAAAKCNSFDSLGELISWADDNYYGEYDSPADLAQEYAEQLGDIPKHLHYYIDWEAYGRDIAMYFCEFNGYYFRA